MLRFRVPLCEICGKKTAKYVCQECGALVCEDHFNIYLAVCERCMAEKTRQAKISYGTKKAVFGDFITISIIWIIAMFLIAVGFLLLTFTPSLGKEGGIIIFPFPFVIHADPLMSLVIFLLMVALIIGLMLYTLFKF